MAGEAQRIPLSARSLKILVRAASVIVCVLLVAFFAIIVYGSSSVLGATEYLERGPYPISVAAGHMETQLVKVGSVVEHTISAKQRMGDDFQSEHPENLEESLMEVGDHLSMIDADYLRDPSLKTELENELVQLEGRINVFLSITDEPDFKANPTKASDYVLQYVTPLRQHMLEQVGEILDESTEAVDILSSDVTRAVNLMLYSSIGLIVAVVAMIIAYSVLLNMRTRLEEDLRRTMQEALEESADANRAKSAFLSNMSHDIRTPMNAIIGLTTIANDNIEDTMRVKQCLTRISTSSQHLLSLINDVLDMNKIESGKVHLAEEEFSVPDLMAEIATIIQSQPAAKKLHCEIVANNLISENLIGDTMRLRQVLLNLTSNAIKYSNEGDTMRLEVRENPSAKPGYSNLTFEVQDTGIGMKKEFLQHIFEPFEREQNDFTIFTEGTGLGMAITKNLVDLMGGTIRIDSELGIGTDVQITIEFKIAPGREERIAETRRECEPLAGKNVLIVDGNPTVLENTQKMLKNLGLNAFGISSAKGAIQAVRDFNENAPIDLAIVDQELFETDCLMLAERLREELPNATFILSAFDLSELEEAAYEKGFRYFVAKPLFRTRLIDVLNKAVSGAAEVLDASQAPDAPDDLTDAGASAKVVASKPKKRRIDVSGRVLVVEDNEINMEIADTLISERGADVETAVNGLEACARIYDNPEGYYDLVFMDVQMPYMDGVEATKAIRKYEKEHGYDPVPIVAMTANAFESDKREVLRAGMTDFVAKPVNVRELEAMLTKYLNSNKA